MASSAPGESRLECPRCGAPSEPGQLSCLECGTALGVGYGRSPRWWLPATIAASIVLLLGTGLGFAVSRVADDGEITAAQVAQAQAPAGDSSSPSDQANSEDGDEGDGGGDGSDGKGDGGGDQGGRDGVDSDGGGGDGGGGDGVDSDGGGGDGGGGDGVDSDGGGGGGGGSRAERGGARGGGGGGASVPQPAPPSDGGADAWPAGRSAYTVILFSSSSRAEAEAQASKAAGAGVLRSDNYSSLEPGLFVVFAGQFESFADAQEQAERYKGSFRGAYPRFVNAGDSG